VFINLTNDAWYLRTAATYQHALGPIARSVECGRWMVRCANTGLSFFCSPAGRPHASLGIFETGYQAMEVVPVSRITPYARWGDIPLLVLALLALALAYIPSGSSRPRV
jgi:apolipoprotein N-acyltransferase